MDKALLIKSIFIFMALWGFALAFLWFRPRVELFWKLLASIIFLFYVWFFYDEFSAGYRSFLLDWYDVTIYFIKELVALVFVNLFFLWPVSLVIIFYKAGDMGAERLLKFMCILTLVLWIIFVIYVYYSKGIDQFLFDNLKKMVPHA